MWLHVANQDGKKPVVVGIHTHGEGKSGGNSGVRLTEDKFRRLLV